MNAKVNGLPTELLHLNVNAWVQRPSMFRTGAAINVRTRKGLQIKFRRTWPKLEERNVEVSGQWSHHLRFGNIFTVDHWRYIDAPEKQTVAENLQSLNRLHG